MNQPLVSVIVPVYNCEQYLQRCLDSVLGQTYKKLEVILVDDGSSDKSLAILKENEKLDSRLKVCKQTNSGPSAARNQGLNICSGKYILFVDADDFIETTMIEKLTAVSDEKAVVLCDNYEISENLTTINQLFAQSGEIAKKAIITGIVQGRIGLVCCKLIPAEIVKSQNIRFDEAIRMSEDQLFFLEIIKYSQHFQYIRESLYYYDRRNDSSITIKYQQEAIEQQLILLDELQKRLNSLTLTEPEKQQLLDIRIKSAVNYCLSNELNSQQRLPRKLTNVKKALSVSIFKEAIGRTKPSGLREKIIYYSFKYNNAYMLFSGLWVLNTRMKLKG
ncbi:MAG: glycosyltransferase family 2 protein [Culicoidibacterales bacterium]